LWKLIKVAWEKQVVPRAWRRAGGVFIPKEKLLQASVSFVLFHYYMLMVRFSSALLPRDCPPSY